MWVQSLSTEGQPVNFWFFNSIGPLQIVVLGLNHTSAPIGIRERAAFVTAELGGAISRLRAVCDECFILSTCNRTELYAVMGHAESGAERLRQFISAERGIPMQELLACTYSYNFESAVSHLFRVASGLDSMVLGETEILGQLKRALEEAHEQNALGSLLGRLGAAALRTGRDARSKTRIGQNRISLVSLAFEEAQRRKAWPAGEPVVAVVGAGETGETVLRHLQGKVTGTTLLANRTDERSRTLAAIYGAKPVAWDRKDELLAESDVIFACTSAEEPVFTSDHFRRTIRKPILCIDLGIPRDIDEKARENEFVTLIDLAGLEQIAAKNRLARVSESLEAQKIVDISTSRFMEWWRSRQVIPTIVGLRALADSIRDEEVERALSGFGPMDARQEQKLRAMAHRIMGRLLHQPLTMLRHDSENGNMAQVLRYLFQLEGSPDPGCGPSGVPCKRVGAGDSLIDEKQPAGRTSP